MKSRSNVLELIGNTPMVRINNFDTGQCELFVKMESQNPGGSIKDRIALSMISAAEQKGLIKPGGVLVEATAGNTGLGLALVASQRGYKLVLVIPDKMSQEKIFHLKAMGAEIVITRSDVGKGHPEYYQEKAQAIATERQGWYVNQFENPDNPRAHEESTAPEIWAQMEGRLDAVVCGVGSGGTLTGFGRYFKKQAPGIDIVLADPEGSILAPYIKTGKMPEAGSWLVEGIGEDFIPKNCELEYVTEAYTIPDSESIAASRELLKKEGIICGSSSGTLLAAALRYCRAQTKPRRVVTLICDSGNKYLSKIFNEYWLDEQGLLSRPKSNDLRDLITRPHLHKGSILVSPNDSLQAAYRKMKMYDVSQLPVMENGKLQGIIHETDILLAVMSSPKGFAISVRDAMVKNLITIAPDQPPESLLPIFEKGMIAIVMEGGEFLGLITPIDFLQYLRKRTNRL